MLNDRLWFFNMINVGERTDGLYYKESLQTIPAKDDWNMKAEKKLVKLPRTEKFEVAGKVFCTNTRRSCTGSTRSSLRIRFSFCRRTRNARRGSGPESNSLLSAPKPTATSKRTKTWKMFCFVCFSSFDARFFGHALADVDCEGVLRV